VPFPVIGRKIAQYPSQSYETIKGSAIQKVPAGVPGDGPGNGPFAGPARTVDGDDTGGAQVSSL